MLDLRSLAESSLAWCRSQALDSSLRVELNRLVPFGGLVSGLSYYGEGELVVSLCDECYCVAVSCLELERVSGMGAGEACCVDGEEHPSPIYYACGRGGRH